jgi:hypothetical protein
MATQVASLPREVRPASEGSAVTSPRLTGSESDRAALESIVLIGDDPLMLRALERLLIRAGYVVGVRERDIELPGDPLPADELNSAALTIVDVPDAWTRSGRLPGAASRRSSRGGPDVLWLSNVGAVGDSAEGCLVKPFTAGQFLAKVESLLNHNTNAR